MIVKNKSKYDLTFFSRDSKCRIMLKAGEEIEQVRGPKGLDLSCFEIIADPTTKPTVDEKVISGGKRGELVRKEKKSRTGKHDKQVKTISGGKD